MLQEISDLSATTDGLRRRWFASPDMDLYVWTDRDDRIVEFQISYNKTHAERVLHWSVATGFRHHVPDHGHSDSLRHKGSPILRAEPGCELETVREKFLIAARKLEHDMHEFILNAIDETLTQIRDGNPPDC